MAHSWYFRERAETALRLARDSTDPLLIKSLQALRPSATQRPTRLMKARWAKTRQTNKSVASVKRNGPRSGKPEAVCWGRVLRGNQYGSSTSKPGSGSTKKPRHVPSLSSKLSSALAAASAFCGALLVTAHLAFNVLARAFRIFALLLRLACHVDLLEQAHVR